MLIEILFWQQKPQMNTGLCLLFLVLYDNNIVTSVSLRFNVQFVFYLTSGHQSDEDVGPCHDQWDTKIWW